MNSEKPQNKYRYERKYVLDVSEYDTLVHNILSDGLEIPFPPRQVNNIYFDNYEGDSYFENVEGESKRNKYRLRWYGERFQESIKSTFEIKMKKDMVNKKKSIPISATPFLGFGGINDVCEHLLEDLEKEDVSTFFELQSKKPTLLNGYSREYFLSADGSTRLTIDRNLFFYNCENEQEHTNFDEMIIEVKYPTKTVPPIDFDKYNLTLSKNSKYVSGLDFTEL